MALPPLRDLDTRYDVKGGSPRTPSGGVPVREYQEYVASNENGNGVWKAIATGLGGLVVGLLLAWFTAFQSKGVSVQQLEDYVDKHSPYVADKRVIDEHQAIQDQALGELRGGDIKLSERMFILENKIGNAERDVESIRSEVKTKMDIVATYLEQQKAKK